MVCLTTLHRYFQKEGWSLFISFCDALAVLGSLSISMRSRSSLTDYDRIDASKRAKTYPVERVATKNSTLEGSSRWRLTGNLCTKFTRPLWKSRGTISGPERSEALQSDQLAFFDLLTTLPKQNKTESVVKMYSLVECNWDRDRALTKSERIIWGFESQETSSEWI